ncbi:hypothetical protein DFJ74DRAFT_448986 [Hyaloraphidium curvatum]|nr:hypothetical protein DFJ74DRAFT_448986 [Hyaloraphidium curvatum]
MAMGADPPVLRTQRVFYLGRPSGPSAAFAADVALEVFGISLTTIGFASLIARRPGVRIDLSNGWHVLSFALGMSWACVAAAIRVTIITAYTSWQWPATWGDSYLNVLDIATVCLVAPFVISVVNQRPTFRDIVRHPVVTLAYLVDLALIVTIPLIAYAILTGYSLFPFMTGLYVSFPLISVMAPFVGVTGVSFGCLLSGLSAGATAVGRWNALPEDQRLAAQFNIRDQMLWIQLFCTILVFASLSFVSVIKDRDRAREHVELQVEQRTEELRQALALVEKERALAQVAAKDKGDFLDFLAHELRNPLHAVANLSETLVEHSGLSPVLSPSLPPQSLLPRSEFKFIDGGPFPRRAALGSDASPSASDQGADISSTARGIQLCTSYMLSLVEEVMAMSSLENGSERVQMAPTDLRELFGKLLAAVSASATGCTGSSSLAMLATEFRL